MYRNEITASEKNTRREQGLWAVLPVALAYRQKALQPGPRVMHVRCAAEEMPGLAVRCDNPVNFSSTVEYTFAVIIPVPIGH